MFLPISKKDMIDRGWETPDFVLVTGDAYVDHPSFGVAIISRVLESYGFKVAILAQPNYKDVSDFRKFGKPNYGFLVTSGVVESMVNNYTVSKKKRKTCVYSPENINNRPDRATIVYANLARQAYKGTSIILGGIEASLRRFAHYDYWQDKIRRSILLDSKADLIVYGMGERAIVEIAESLRNGVSINDITFVDGTVYKTKDISTLDAIELPAYDLLNKELYAKSFLVQTQNTDHLNSSIITEKYGDWYVVQNIPAKPLNTHELDKVYNLPYQRTYHPVYKNGIKAITEVKHSIIANRGCFGECNFCALSYHQGRAVTSRSESSIVKEATLITKMSDFKGYINDIGGPTANFFEMCNIQPKHGACKDKRCLTPKCNNLKVSHKKYLKILKSVRSLPGIKKVFIRSGVRYDYVMYDKNPEFFNELVKHHISGQLRVAPEHINNYVLRLMGKPDKNVYEDFVSKFNSLNDKHKKNQYIVPYLISSHPGSTIEASIELAEYLHINNQYPEQVQDFYPTPGTLSTVMYYTGINPLTMEKVYIPKEKEKKLQRALLQYKDPKNKKLIKEALMKAGRQDLIGYDKNCLIRP